MVSPSPGIVRIHPLTADGLPTPEIKAKILAATSAEDVRPLCDYVEVVDPDDVPFNVVARLTVLSTHDAEAVRQRALSAVQSCCAAIASRLGRDVARSAIIAAAHVDGVASVQLVAPNADISVPETAWAHAASIDISVEGVTHG